MPPRGINSYFMPGARKTVRRRGHVTLGAASRRIETPDQQRDTHRVRVSALCRMLLPSLNHWQPETCFSAPC